MVLCAPAYAEHNFFFLLIVVNSLNLNARCFIDWMLNIINLDALLFLNHTLCCLPGFFCHGCSLEVEMFGQ